jgi:hypothetical protein
MSASTASRHVLYDMPVSNHGARCRIILYKVCSRVAGVIMT